MEVRRVRGSLQLRIDGTLASLRRPGRTLTGDVWWTLAAPVLLLPACAEPRVLLLGLGAGSVARAIRALAPQAAMVGVECQTEVLRLARRHFGLDALRVELVVDDALRYLRRERRRFDLVVEDLFVGPSRSVRKPGWLLGDGYPLLRRRLARGGLVACNTIHETPAVVRALRPLGRVASLAVRDHYNHIVVAGRELPPPRELRQLLAAEPRLARVLRRLSIRSRS